MNKSILTYFFILIFAVILFPTGKVIASNQPVVGYAWSDTIGWVSFSSINTGGSPNGINYGVFIDEANGVFSGYAWNDAIGWISFNSTETAQCGSPAIIVGVPNNITGEISGYARAISGNTLQSGGWTGCIELSGINHSSPDFSGNGGVTFNNNSGGGDSITGYAWGAIPSISGNGGNDSTGKMQDGIIGWLSFVNVSVNLNFTQPNTQPNLKLDATPNPASANGSDLPSSEIFNTTLYWVSDIPMTGCIASGGWSGNKDNPSLSLQTPPNPSQIVSVSSNPTSFTISCDDSLGNNYTNTVDVNRIERNPIVDLTINGLSSIPIPSSGIVDLAWDSSYSSGCIATDSNGWSTGGLANGSVSVKNITAPTIFSIKCISVYGSPIVATDSVSVYKMGGGQGGVNINPKYEEI